jgi:pyruvate dehydrogenase E1 component alpha subunit
MRISNKKMIEMYTTMAKIRRFEESIEELTASGTITGFVHLYLGQEAIAAGICATLRDTDYITSNHRGHGHLIAKGGRTDLMMAELFAKQNGYCKGKGGSMHIADMDLGILGANGIVGGGPPLACGAALAAQYNDRDDVSVCFFGDGAANQGTIHESMNLASVWSLPVIFVVENNGYGEFMSQKDHMRIENIADRAGGYGMPAEIVDGNDVIAVYTAASKAVRRVRSGKGPVMIECKTFRIAGHFVGDPESYRDKQTVKNWQKPDKDPISRFEKVLLNKKILSTGGIKKLKQDVYEEIKRSVEFAKSCPDPNIEDLMEDVYAA